MIGLLAASGAYADLLNEVIPETSLLGFDPTPSADFGSGDGYIIPPTEDRLQFDTNTAPPTPWCVQPSTVCRRAQVCCATGMLCSGMFWMAVLMPCGSTPIKLTTTKRDVIMLMRVRGVRWAGTATGESIAAVIVLILHQALLFLLNPQLILSHQPQHPLLFLLLLR